MVCVCMRVHKHTCVMKIHSSISDFCFQLSGKGGEGGGAERWGMRGTKERVLRIMRIQVMLRSLSICN